MKKTCSVNKKCLSFSPGFSWPARCKFIVLIFKINFLWFWPPEPENRFPRFFRKYSASGENEPHQVTSITNTYSCAKYERNRFFNFCRRMLDVHWKSSLSPDMKMHILLTVLHTFGMEFVRRICPNIEISHPWWSLSLFSSLECLDKYW